MIGNRIAGELITDRAGAAVQHRRDARGMFARAKLIDRRGHNAGDVVLAQLVLVRDSELQHLRRLVRAERQGYVAARIQRAVVRQEYAHRQALSLLRKTDDVRPAAHAVCDRPLHRVEDTGHHCLAHRAVAVRVPQRERGGLVEIHAFERLGRVGRQGSQGFEPRAVGVGKVEANRQRLPRVMLERVPRVGLVKLCRHRKGCQLIRRPADVLSLAALSDQPALKVDIPVVGGVVGAVQAAHPIHLKHPYALTRPASAVAAEHLHLIDRFDRRRQRKEVLVRPVLLKRHVIG